MTIADAPISQVPARRDAAPVPSIATRAYNPLAPIGNPGALKSLLDSQKNSFATMLPKHITPERLLKTMLVAVNRNPKILQCTQASILETINRAAELGLDLSGTLGEAYPVPFNNKVKDDSGKEVWVNQLQLIIGYRGMEKLAWQSGEVESIDAECVYSNDHFVFRKGTEVNVEWSPALTGDRGKMIGAYACVKMKSGGKLARFIPLSDLNKIRNSSKSKDSPAWKYWEDEMHRKSALKRTLKDAPLSTEKLTRAMETDAVDHELADVVIAETTRGTAGLVEDLRSRGQSTGEVADTTPRDEQLRKLNETEQQSNPNDSAPKTEAPADSTAPATENEPTDAQPETVPEKMDDAQILAWSIATYRPTDVGPEDAERAMKRFFATSMNKPWKKLNEADRRRLLSAWDEEGHPAFKK